MRSCDGNWEPLRGPTWLFVGAFWSSLGALGRLLGASWVLLGASWIRLGLNLELLDASWAQLGASWAPLGRNLEPLGRLFVSCAPDLGSKMAFGAPSCILHSQYELQLALQLPFHSAPELQKM